MIVLAIDPGVAGEGNACAWFECDELLETWFERVPKRVEDAGTPRAVGTQHCDCVVIERPQQDERSRSSRPKDLIDLAWEGALLAGAFAGRDGTPIVALTPTAWKGSESKPAMHARLWITVLNGHEREILGGEDTWRVIQKAREKGALDRWSRPGASYYPRTWTMHNKLDAVCLGAVFIGRMRKVG